MTYNRDNILNLRVKRGGAAIYTIRHVYSNTIEMIYGSRVCFCMLSNGLRYLESGKWTVVGTGVAEQKQVVEEIYQIY